jgi:Asp-tRNA(Asn)/Glu-tRNA(Gln) amidotransferase A subunit family amidase
VQKLEEAGAVIIGKTNMHELGLGRSFGEARRIR